MKYPKSHGNENMGIRRTFNKQIQQQLWPFNVLLNNKFLIVYSGIKKDWPSEDKNRYNSTIKNYYKLIKFDNSVEDF